MKATKHFTIIAIIAIIALAIIGCKGDEPTDTTNDDNVVKERSKTITPVEGITITVKGEFDKTGLNNASGKIKTAIQKSMANAECLTPESSSVLRWWGTLDIAF